MFPILREHRYSEVSDRALETSRASIPLPVTVQPPLFNASRVNVVQYTGNCVQTAVYVNKPYPPDSDFERSFRALCGGGQYSLDIRKISSSSDAKLVVEIWLTSPIKGETHRVLSRLRSSLAVQSDPPRSQGAPSSKEVKLPGGLVARRQSLPSAKSAVQWEIINPEKLPEISVTVVHVLSSAAAETLGIFDSFILGRASNSHILIGNSEEISDHTSIFVVDLCGSTEISGHQIVESQEELLDILDKVKVRMTVQKSVQWRKPIVLFAISGVLNGYVLSDPAEYLKLAIAQTEYERLRSLTTAVQAVRLRDLKDWLLNLATSQGTKYSGAWLAGKYSDVDRGWDEFVQKAMADAVNTASRNKGASQEEVIRKFRRRIEGGVKAEELTRTLKWKLGNLQSGEVGREVYEAMLEEAVEETRGEKREAMDEFVQVVKNKFIARGRVDERLRPEIAREVFEEWRVRQVELNSQRTQSMEETKVASEHVTSAGGCCVIS